MKRGLSLRHELALLLAVLTVTTLVAAVAAAYEEVRRSAITLAGERLERVSHQLSDLVEASVQQRGRMITEAGSSAGVTAALSGGPVDTAALRVALDPIRAPGDSLLPIQLWSADGRLRYSSVPVAGAGTGWTPPLPLEERPTWGPFRATGARTTFWSAYPVMGPTGPLGWVVESRGVGNPSTAEQIESLIGSETRVYFAYRGDSLWVGLAGDAAPGPVADVAPDRDLLFSRAGEGRHIARAEPVQGTPWSVIVEAPTGAFEQRPATFLRRMLLTGALLVLVVGGLGWVGGLRLTRPLEELASAADAVATGDYERRVAAHGDDELGRLARAFNAMAEQVSRSHRELRRRFEEARTLALDLERANVEAEKAREAAQSAARVKSDFLATMSHEIRTPINAVQGYAELLRLEIPGPLTEQQKEYLERIGASTRLLIALVSDILDFSRMESGELQVYDESGSVADAMEAARAVVEPLAQGKGIALTAACPEDVRFRGDGRRVEQILLNLLSNAIKFTPAGGSVGLSCSVEPVLADGGPDGRPGPWVALAVEDTGIGIPEEELARVFEPFVQADSGYTRNHGGAGLGLTISRRLAVKMGGEVTASSTRGAGSRFTLWLPLASTDVGVPPEDEGVPAEGEGVPSQG